MVDGVECVGEVNVHDVKIPVGACGIFQSEKVA